MDLQDSTSDKETPPVKREDESHITSEVPVRKKACIICLGMAGSGKTTFVQVSRSARRGKLEE